MRSSDLVDDRQTKWADSGTVAKHNAAVREWMGAEVGAEVRMLSQDISSAILPYTTRDRIVAEVVPENKRAEELIAYALRRERYGAPRFDDEIEDFIREVAGTLLSFGVADYEVTRVANRETHEYVGFGVEWVHPYTIQRRRWKWVQDLGPDVARRWECERYLPVDRSRIVSFHLPKPWNARGLKKMIRRLAVPSANLIPEFALDPSQQVAGYDFDVFIEGRDRAIAAATRSIGWNARGGLSKRTTEFYWIIRELRYRSFLADLRDAILATLNLAIVAPLRELGVSGVVRLVGLPSRRDFSQVQTEVEGGTDIVAAARRLRELIS